MDRKLRASHATPNGKRRPEIYFSVLLFFYPMFLISVPPLRLRSQQNLFSA
jgi:hypothetical protein